MNGNVHVTRCVLKKVCSINAKAGGWSHRGVPSRVRMTKFFAKTYQDEVNDGEDSIRCTFFVSARLYSFSTWLKVISMATRGKGARFLEKRKKNENIVREVWSAESEFAPPPLVSLALVQVYGVVRGKIIFVEVEVARSEQ
ncbi:hypothetical protein ACFE04_026771 [Oxalis oulophora]